jgi:hypothetical protein
MSAVAEKQSISARASFSLLVPGLLLIQATNATLGVTRKFKRHCKDENIPKIEIYRATPKNGTPHCTFIF